MEKQSGAGFTVVEIIITMTIIVILSTLVVVRLTSTQAGGRDQERESDINTIATALEVYYQNGSAVAGIPKGYYPGSQQVTTAAATTPPFREFLEGVSEASYIAPDQTGVSFGTHSSPAGSNSDGSYTDAQARSLLSSTPYLYQPLRRNNSFCTVYTECVKFNLYYLRERDNAVVKIRSKNQ